VAEERQISVNVPPGIEDGMRLRLQGEGDAGLEGGPSGDLFLHVTVKGKKKLTREGRDLVAQCRVSMAAAALGGTIEAPSLEGTETVDLPAGTQPGEEIVVKGKGLPPLGGGRRGNLVCRITVVVPESVTEEQRELLGRFDEIERSKKGGLKGKLLDWIKR
jgi:molecular chaperone DnaJ